MQGWQDGFHIKQRSSPLVEICWSEAEGHLAVAGDLFAECPVPNPGIAPLTTVSETILFHLVPLLHPPRHGEPLLHPLPR